MLLSILYLFLMIKAMEYRQKSISIPEPIAKGVDVKIKDGHFRGWSDYLTHILAGRGER